MTSSIPLTAKNHGGAGNPHPQYDSVATYSSIYDSSGNPWLKIFEVKIASIDLKLKDTMQRFYFGFKVVDDASDYSYSVVEFNGYVGIDYTSNVITQGTKKALHQSYYQPNFYDLNLHLLSKMNVDGSYQVVAYLKAPWNYKRITIIQPWIDVAKQLFITTADNILMTKSANFEKTNFLFGQIANRGFEATIMTDGFKDYVLSEDAPTTYTKVETLSTGIQATCGRVGNLVTINLRGESEHTIDNNTMGYIPKGYRPAPGTAGTGFRFDDAKVPLPFTIGSDGKITLVGTLIPGKIYYGIVSYITVEAALT